MSDLKSSLLNGSAAKHLNEGIVPPPKAAISQHNVPPRPGPPGPRVMLALPSGRTWEARTATAVAGLATYSALHGVQIGIANLEGSMITKQRNDLVKMAIDQNMEYMMWIDTDMLMPPDALLRLLRHDRSVVGATYNKRVPPFETLGRLKGPKPEDIGQGGVHEAELMPGGFMLVKTEVYRRIGWPYYWETYQWPGDTGVDALKTYLRNCFYDSPPEHILDELDRNEELGKWLQAQHDDDKTRPRWDYYSEDLNFCRKLRKHNIKLFCDLSLTFQMVHLGTMEVTCKPPPVEPLPQNPEALTLSELESIIPAQM